MKVSDDKLRLRIFIQGAVQGVGFRPFVYQLAERLNLAGWVNNSPQGVMIEAEGSRGQLKEFADKVCSERPSHSVITSMETWELDPAGYESFEIRASAQSGETTATVLPDLATCPACLKELFDPHDRRYLYPFINCTYCGPRFSIIRSLPYDRPNTSMSDFPMCDECRAEYKNPRDRRFHAQPVACPKCGPQLQLWDGQGKTLRSRHEALLEAAAMIRAGKVVALKGIGGFQLLVDARPQDAVLRLRQRKNREEKPFAIMFPTIDKIREECEVSHEELQLLTGSAAPIVLLRRHVQNSIKTEIAPAVAPSNPHLGVMLPYSPLHHLLMAELGFPIVATSGNLSDEPMCIDEHEALERLSGIADYFLVHNRPILRQVDDSVARVIEGRELLLRRARGYAPMPILLKHEVHPTLAVGAHLKNTVAIAFRKTAVLSQHIGDLESAEAYRAFENTIGALSRLYDFRPEIVACDQHPDYLSTRYAHDAKLPLVEVQHHHAHILGTMAENDIEGGALGVSWDGTGYGADNTVWGGEFLRIRPDNSFERFARLRHFALPGGDRAVREPRRVALAVLHEIHGKQLDSFADIPTFAAFTGQEQNILLNMLEKRLSSPLTSSAGRVFDAVSSILGLRQILRYEGQAAMELEALAATASTDEKYPFNVKKNTTGPAVIDWVPMFLGIIESFRQGQPASLIAARFHNTMAEIILAVATMAGEKRVVLSGGVFQNKVLLERSLWCLRKQGFYPYWPQRVPPNDGGIALGQVIAASSVVKSTTST